MPDAKYAAWIAANVPASPYSLCHAMCLRMQATYPELKLVRGHYHCHVWGERSHWWLVTPAGDIVDPTAAQFPSNGHGAYVPWDEEQEEPSGKCMQCGAYCYGGYSVCSEACRVALVAYYAAHGHKVRA